MTRHVAGTNSARTGFLRKGISWVEIYIGSGAPLEGHRHWSSVLLAIGGHVIGPRRGRVARSRKAEPSILPSDAMSRETTEAASSSDEKQSTLWALLPSFDPGQDDPREYTEKVRFLKSICPTRDLPMLAPRLAMQMKGAAWGQVKTLNPKHLADPDRGVETLLKAVSTWEESAELRAYENFEKALYKVNQKADESTMSYVNRMEVAFMEMGQVTVSEMKAFVLLRQSYLNAEDKKKVLVMTQGQLEADKVAHSMRQLNTRVLTGSTEKKKTYSVNFVEDDDEETSFVASHGPDDSWDEETAMQALYDQGDDDACLVAEFEDQLIETCQESPELSNVFSAYAEARSRLRDKIRARGFWPPRKGKGKGGVGKKGMFGKGGGFRKRQSLAERIAGSHCRLCGQKGHWKQECPQRESLGARGAGAEANVVMLEQYLHVDPEPTEVYDEVPPEEPEMSDDRTIDGSTQASPPVGHVSLGMLVDESLAEFIGVAVVEGSRSARNSEDLSDRLRRGLLGILAARPCGSEPEQVHVVESGCPGIIDTGASKTVIGRQKMQSLLATLSPDIRARVQWRKSNTVFRFGNDGVLESTGALFVPFGRRWMKIEVVEGKTPFLISVAFLKAVRASIHVHSQELEVPGVQRRVKLLCNSKGLFHVDLNELLNSMAGHDGEVEHEIVSMVSVRGEQEPTAKVVPARAPCVTCQCADSHGSSRCRQLPERCDSAALSGGPAVEHGRGRGGRGDCPSPGGPHPGGVEPVEVDGGIPPGQDLPRGGDDGPAVCEVHAVSSQADVQLGVVLPELPAGQGEVGAFEPVSAGGVAEEPGRVPEGEGGSGHPDPGDRVGASGEGIEQQAAHRGDADGGGRRWSAVRRRIRSCARRLPCWRESWRRPGRPSGAGALRLRKCIVEI